MINITNIQQQKFRKYLLPFKTFSRHHNLDMDIGYSQASLKRTWTK